MATKKRNIPDDNKKGGSRAAKKRAKKKEKQLQLSLSATTTSVSDDGGITEKQANKDVGTTSKVAKQLDPKPLLKQKNKMQLPLGDDEDGDEIVKEVSILSTKKKERKEKKAKIEDLKYDSKVLNNEEYEHDQIRVEVDDEDDDDHDKERENMILNQILSHLTPAEILFPQRFQGKKSDEQYDESKEEQLMQPDPLEIASVLPTTERANRLFKAIIEPSGLSTEAFYEHYWEKKPLLISTSENLAEPDSGGAIYGDDLELEGEELKEYQGRFDGFLSKKSIEKLISDFPMKYGKDLNVTNYCDSGTGEKRRVTLDQLPNKITSDDGDAEYIDAESNDVWSNFKSGCTIRLLCPQVSTNVEVSCLILKIWYLMTIKL